MWLKDGCCPATGQQPFPHLKATVNCSSRQPRADRGLSGGNTAVNDPIFQKFVQLKIVERNLS
jgi:hypothetical protein